MKINLYDLLSANGKEEKQLVSFEKQDVSYLGEQFTAKSRDDFEIILAGIDKDKVNVRFDATFIVTRKCSRCLDDVVNEYDISYDHVIDVEKGCLIIDESGELDEISYIEESNLDVNLLILDELCTVLPMNVLCREDCKGICKVCFINLNRETCDCDQTVPDPRMAVFGDVFKQFKEV